MWYTETEGAVFSHVGEPGLTAVNPASPGYAVGVRHGFAWLISLSVSIDEPRARLEVRFRQRHNVMITDVFWLLAKPLLPLERPFPAERPKILVTTDDHTFELNNLL